MSPPHWRWKRKDGVKGCHEVLQSEEAAQQVAGADLAVENPFPGILLKPPPRLGCRPAARQAELGSHECTCTPGGAKDRPYRPREDASENHGSRQSFFLHFCAGSRLLPGGVSVARSTGTSEQAALTHQKGDNPRRTGRMRLCRASCSRVSRLRSDSRPHQRCSGFPHSGKADIMSARLCGD